MVNKIIKAAVNGLLIHKIKKKIHECYHNYFNIIYIKNKDVKAQAYQCKDYQKLYYKYRKIIDNGSSYEFKGQKSNKVWVLWLQGYDNAPDLVKACINSIHASMPQKDVVLLTLDNYKDYIELPIYIERKFNKKMITMAHFSDLLRISLLAKWGGMWIDSTALCTNKDFFEYVSTLPLFVFKELNLGNRDARPILASNWFIACEIGNPIVTLTRDLLYAYWKDYDFAVNYFIFHLFFAMSCRRYLEEWEKVPVFNNNTPHVLMFELNKEYSDDRWKQILNMSGIHKLQRYDDFSNLKTSNYSHILKEFL